MKNTAGETEVIISDTIKEVLQWLVDQPPIAAERMNAVTNEIRFVQDVLKKIQFIGGDVVSLPVMGHDNNSWLLEYDIKNKTICCGPDSEGKSKALLQHTFVVRQHMLQHLPYLIQALRGYK